MTDVLWLLWTISDSVQGHMTVARLCVWSTPGKDHPNISM